jgi:hypothetical protein
MRQCVNHVDRQATHNVLFDLGVDGCAEHGVCASCAEQMVRLPIVARVSRVSANGAPVCRNHPVRVATHDVLNGRGGRAPLCGECARVYHPVAGMFDLQKL